MATMPWMASKGPNGLAHGVTRYLWTGNTACDLIATETNTYTTIRTAGVWSNLYIRISANDLGATSTLTSRVNLAAGGQSVSVGAGASGDFEDTSGSDTLAAGDEMTTQIVTGAGGTSMVIRAVSSLFAASSGSMMLWVNSSSSSVTVNGATRFYALTGSIGGDTTINQTEAQCQYSSRGSFTWKNLCVNVRTNTKGGNSFVKSRVNGADGAMSVTVGAGATGLMEDTSGSDAVVSGDEINLAVAYFADGNALRFWSIKTEATSTGASLPTVAADGNTALVVLAGATAYHSSGLAITGAVSTTETDYRTEANVAHTLSFLSAYVIANSITANTTLRVRKDGANGNGLITVGSGATGYVEDAVNTDRFALGEELSYQIVAGATGTSITFNSIANVVDLGRTTKNTRGWPLGTAIGMNWRGAA